MYDFGKIKEGQNVEINFRFKNTGNAPLVIGKAEPSCGCTVTEKPEQPVMPGETGYIKARFNSEGRQGTAHKAVNVVSNADPAFPPLLIKGEVLPK